MTELRRTFESAAETYDAARPSYPEQLFDDLVILAGLEPSARLLEIGCGTGKATRPLAERGFEVVCVELGTKLAGHARANLEGLPVVIEVSPFRELGGPSRLRSRLRRERLALARSAAPLPEGPRAPSAKRPSSVLGREPRVPAALRPLLHRDPGRLRRTRRELRGSMAAPAAGCGA